MITKAKFFSYYRVQMSGRYNMIMEAKAAMNDAHLTEDEYFEIINNYSKYFNQFKVLKY